MPDITLYEDDVELIRDALGFHRAALRERAVKRVVDESTYEEIANLERVRDIMLDRLVQHRHPKREARVELDL
jgi:hypothetical protein